MDPDKKSISKLTVANFAVTDVGGRGNNEDAFLACDLSTGAPVLTRAGETAVVSDAGLLIMVIDGMGGANGGEVASQIVRDTVKEFLVGKKDELAAGKMADDGRAAAEVLLEQALLYADQRCHEEAGKQNLKGMGACVTAVIVEGNSLHLANAGDSRTYRITGDRIEQLSYDDSIVAEFVRSGLVTPEQARKHPRRNELTQCIGPMDVAPKIQTRTLPLAANDMLLLCSDGLHGVVEDAMMLKIATAASDPRKACQDLVAAAKHAKTTDNVTAAICRVVGDGMAGVTPPADRVSAAPTNRGTPNPDPAPQSSDAPTESFFSRWRLPLIVAGAAVIALALGLLAGKRMAAPDFKYVCVLQNGSVGIKQVGGGLFGKQALQVTALYRQDDLDPELVPVFNAGVGFRQKKWATDFVLQSLKRNDKSEDTLVGLEKTLQELTAYRASLGAHPAPAAVHQIAQAAVAIEGLCDQDSSFVQAHSEFTDQTNKAKPERQFAPVEGELLDIVGRAPHFISAQKLLANIYSSLGKDAELKSCSSIIKSTEEGLGLNDLPKSPTPTPSKTTAGKKPSASAPTKPTVSKPPPKRPKAK